uniref:Uncharacterized protein n=1 Tax=uncultured prokaryote TaxID=198431 RepID=A0A0H5Q4R6_9ZZZZ|nr:hypothetical protein [uncultured prokaryote]
MRYQLVVTAYDVMDQVFIAVAVGELGPTETHRSVPPLSRSTTVRGTGESDPTEWARDALVAALEVL